MANFSIVDDEEYDDIFLTQTPSNTVVSLEDPGEFITVHNLDYSDISDDEQDRLEERLR